MKLKIFTAVACIIGAATFSFYPANAQEEQALIILDEGASITCNQFAGEGAKCWEKIKDNPRECKWTGKKADTCD